MVMLVIFCTNAINILAGVNGLEAGQTFIIACAVTFHNLWILAGHGADSPSVHDGHLFSLYLMLPLATTTLALLVFNWYPSQARAPAFPDWLISKPQYKHAGQPASHLSTAC